LLTEGVPVSWSPHPQYKDVTFYQNPDHTLFRLVRPYLEHPPFFGLIAGMSNMLFGVRDFDDVEIPTIRPLAFVLGIFSIAAVFFFAASFNNRDYKCGNLLYISVYSYRITHFTE